MPTDPSPTGDTGPETVRSLVTGDSLDLNVVQAGPGPGPAPTVVFVHGYPDTSAVWLPVVARLADDFHCVMYDVRGAGESGVPTSRAGYQVAHLVSDLVAVLDATSPDRPVHLVGHDWGSVQTWEAVLLAGTDPRLRGRIATYTTMSGPALGHFARWVRQAPRGSWGRRRSVAGQLAHSWYIAAFQVPVLPELGLRAFLRDPRRARHLLGARQVAPTVAADAVHGLDLYRANLRASAGQPRHSLHTDLPVQLLVPLRDPFLTPAVYDDLPQYCSDLTRHDLDAGHWAQQTAPDQVAERVREFVLAHEPSA